MGKGNTNEIASGAILIGIGAFFLVSARTYPMGTASEMGPGYFPIVLSSLLIVLGIIVLVVGWRSAVETPPIEWRPFLMVLAGIACFGVLMSFFGLAPAIFVGVLVAAYGDRSPSFPSMAALALGIAIGTWLIFSVALGLPIPIFKMPA